MRVEEEGTVGRQLDGRRVRKKADLQMRSDLDQDLKTHIFLLVDETHLDYQRICFKK